ncbi:MAG: nuclear transport factor 2 family protein [Asticcacaulis sp.]|nr:nuclear transport factor 2 family protein [Asticcacaulis sp.]
MSTPDDKLPDEAAIRALVDAFVKAIRARDIDAVMSVFAPEIVSFDLGPPLSHGGGEDFRQRWQTLFAAHTGPVDYDIRDLSITVGGDVAFSHSLNRTGAAPERWVRWTACYRRIDGWWRIVHEHVSVPVDMRSGAALLDLAP